MMNFQEYEAARRQKDVIATIATIIGSDIDEAAACHDFLCRHAQPILALIEANNPYDVEGFYKNHGKAADDFWSGAGGVMNQIGKRFGRGGGGSQSGALGQTLRGLWNGVKSQWYKPGGGWRDRLWSRFGDAEAKARVGGYDAAVSRNKKSQDLQRRYGDLYRNYVNVYGDDFLDHPEAARQLKKDRGFQMLKKLQAQGASFGPDGVDLGQDEIDPVAAAAARGLKAQAKSLKSQARGFKFDRPAKPVAAPKPAAAPRPAAAKAPPPPSGRIKI